MLDRTTSRNLFAPRRQERKEKTYGFSELGVLCVFARVIFSDSVIQNNANFKYVWLGFKGAIDLLGGHR
jgi:hypothetical protein